MATHYLRDAADAEFVLHLDADGSIAKIEGPWPEADVEFELTGDLPLVVHPTNVPDSVMKEAMKRGLEVCYYDDVHCRTCYCDGSGKVIRCVGHC